MPEYVDKFVNAIRNMEPLDTIDWKTSDASFSIMRFNNDFMFSNGAVDFGVTFDAIEVSDYNDCLIRLLHDNRSVATVYAPKEFN